MKFMFFLLAYAGRCVCVCERRGKEGEEIWTTVGKDDAFIYSGTSANYIDNIERTLGRGAK